MVSAFAVLTTADASAHSTVVAGRTELVRPSVTFTDDVADEHVCTPRVIRQPESSSLNEPKHSAQQLSPTTRARCRWERWDGRVDHDFIDAGDPRDAESEVVSRTLMVGVSGETECFQALKASILTRTTGHGRSKRRFSRTRRQERKSECQ